MSKLLIKSITGKDIEVTNIDFAIKQCETCKNSPFVISGTKYTIGQDNRFMLPQLWKLKKDKTYERNNN